MTGRCFKFKWNLVNELWSEGFEEGDVGKKCLKQWNEMNGANIVHNGLKLILEGHSCFHDLAFPHLWREGLCFLYRSILKTLNVNKGTFYLFTNHTFSTAGMYVSGIKIEGLFKINPLIKFKEKMTSSDTRKLCQLKYLKQI